MPELQTRQVVARGKLQDIADYLDCSRATLWRRMKDHPECFVRIGRSLGALPLGNRLTAYAYLLGKFLLRKVILFSVVK